MLRSGIWPHNKTGIFLFRFRPFCRRQMLTSKTRRKTSWGKRNAIFMTKMRISTTTVSWSTQTVVYAWGWPKNVKMATRTGSLPTQMNYWKN